MYYVTAYICSTFFTLLLQNQYKNLPLDSCSFQWEVFTIVLFSYDRFFELRINLFHHSFFDDIVVTQQFFHYGALYYTEQRLLQCI